MAGHSPWANIKHRKAAVDKKRGKLWTKLSKAIIVAAQMGGGDVEANPTLRTMVQKARDSSVPVDNIERAIKRGTGELEGVSYETHTYEAYGPGGAALLIDCLTDNTNRTVSDVRYALDHHDGSLGASGSVSWQFERKGHIVVDASRYAEDVVFEAAIDAGAEDVASASGEHVVTTEVGRLAAGRDALERAGIEVSSAELTRVAKVEVAVTGRIAERLVKLLEALEELDDVQKVYSNADIDEAVLAGVGSA